MVLAFAARLVSQYVSDVCATPSVEDVARSVGIACLRSDKGVFVPTIERVKQFPRNTAGVSLVSASFPDCPAGRVPHSDPLHGRLERGGLGELPSARQ